VKIPAATPRRGSRTRDGPPSLCDRWSAAIVAVSCGVRALQSSIAALRRPDYSFRRSSPWPTSRASFHPQSELCGARALPWPRRQDALLLHNLNTRCRIRCIFDGVFEGCDAARPEPFSPALSPPLCRYLRARSLRKRRKRSTIASSDRYAAIKPADARRKCSRRSSLRSHSPASGTH